MAETKNPYTDADDIHLVKYLAKHKPEPRGRLGNVIYEQLVENAEGKWPWAKNHSWQSWREHYKKNQDVLDRKIRIWQKKQQDDGDDVQEGPSTRKQKPKPPVMTPKKKVPFTNDDDLHLARYLATQSADLARLGQSLYKILEAQDEEYPWAKRHPWQSWRERYKKNQEAFDRSIIKIQKKLAKRQEDEAAAEDDVQEGPSTRVEIPAPSQSPRKKIMFTDSDDEHLAEFLATRGSDMGRLGTSLYKTLEEEDEELPWVKRHSWQSWRERYKKNQGKIEGLVSTYEQRKRAEKKKKGKAPAEKRRVESPAPRPEASTSTSHSTANAKGKGRAVQAERSTHIETRQERTSGPEKNQRVNSVTPVPVSKSSKPQAPPRPSSNAKGKQKEVVPMVPQRQPNFEGGGTVSGTRTRSKESSVPPIAVKTQEASDDDTVMHSLFGTDDEEEVDELEDSQKQNTTQVAPRVPAPAPPQKKKKDLPPERILVPSSSQPVPSSPAPPPPPSLPPAEPLRRKAPAPKPRLSKKDENIFVSSDAEPSPSPRRTRPSPHKHYANPPKIIEGPFRSRLKRVRSRVESDSDEAPPKRARVEQEPTNKSDENDKARAEKVQPAATEDRHSQEQAKENIVPEAAVPVVKKGTAHLHRARKVASNGVPATRAPVPAAAPAPTIVSSPSVQAQSSAGRGGHRENAVASSSRIQLSDIPPLRKETPVAPAPAPVSVPKNQAPKPATAPRSSLKKPVPTPGLPQRPDAMESVPAKSSSPRRDSGVVISPGSQSEADFFNAPLTGGHSKGKDREYVLDARPPRIDLRRQSLNRRQSQVHTVSMIARTGSRASSASVSASNLSATASHSRRGPAVVEPRRARMSVASERAVSALVEWMQPVIDMAAEYGLPDTVAIELFQRLLSMEKTEVVLYALSCDLTEEEGLKAYRHKKTVARAKQALAHFAQSKKMLEEDVSSGSGEEEMPSGLVLRSQAPSAPASSVKIIGRRESGSSAHTQTNAQAQAPSTSARRRSRPSLIIRRLPSDEEDAVSDYVPPRNSRAGQYARLQKQGRLAEAKEREMNRILITETQTQYVPVHAHSPTVSPTPHARMQGQDGSQVLMDDSAMAVDHQEVLEAEVDVEEQQEQGATSDEDMFVDAEEEVQGEGLAIHETVEEAEMSVRVGDDSLFGPVYEESEEEEDVGPDGAELPDDSDSEEQRAEPEEDDEEEDEPVAAEIEEDEHEMGPDAEKGEDDEEEGEDEDEEEPAEEVEEDAGDNGIFGSRESEQEFEDYHEERGTSSGISDFDPDEIHRASSPAVPKLHRQNPVEGNKNTQNSQVIEEDEDEDIYMPESLEMPPPGQPPRQEDSQEDAEVEPPVAEPQVLSSTSHMEPSSLPSHLTFESGSPEKNPAVADIAQTHQKLALGVTAENRQQLEDFEEKHSDKSDLLRLWSIKWAKALMRHHSGEDV